MRKRIISLLLFFLFLLPAGPSALAEDAKESPQPETEPVGISDPEGLMALADNPDGNFILTADIDMAGIDWTPIPFSGTLDGAGYTLYNLQIKTVGQEVRVTRDGDLKPYDTVFAGLFSTLENARITDLKLVGAQLEIEGNNHCFVGLLAGYMFKSDVQGCSVQGRLRLNNYAEHCGIGGLVGYGAGDFGYCRSDVELILDDQCFDATCEQYLGGILSCGLANIEDCIVHLDAYNSSHGHIHCGGLVGMYYYCGMDVHAQSVRRNQIFGQISFFEDNPVRRAFCKPELGAEYSVPGNFYSNEDEDFEIHEFTDTGKVLLPEQCDSPDIRSTVTPPGCDSWGYVYNECAGCGYHWIDSYFPPQHSPSDWEITDAAVPGHDGQREKRCIVCGELLESESYAYVEPEPVYVEETVTIYGCETTETLGVQYKSSAQAMHAADASGPLEWVSENPEIASVDQDGTIHGLARGTATVRYASEDGLFSGVCTVTVYYSFWQWLIIILGFGWLWYI